ADRGIPNGDDETCGRATVLSEFPSTNLDYR
ncbi:unnamed protein product, partial [Rotaria socialis]